MIKARHTHPVTATRRPETSTALTRLSARWAVWVTVGLLALLCLSSPALAAPRHVVPPGGTVAGETNSYWLARSWQKVFNTSAPVDPCQSLTAHRQRVRYLTLTTVAPGTDRYACTVPAGRPIYAVGLSNECSTFNGDHGAFGTTDSALRTCARAGFNGVHQTTTIDGRAIDSHKLLAATGAFPSALPPTTSFHCRRATAALRPTATGCCSPGWRRAATSSTREPVPAPPGGTSPLPCARGSGPSSDRREQRHAAQGKPLLVF